MNRETAAIAGRLSLRQPQREALDLLDAATDLIPLRKDQDVAAALAAIHSTFPTVQDFERDFPSLCFALATGVGKTRLMGAFIAWLRRVKGIRHFFVLAPNLTIYNKLILDFTPGNAKYVFQGLSDFAVRPPELITGENWESGRSVRGDLFGEGDLNINVFNISKINSEVRGGRTPRVRELNEFIGQSYFDYLAGLPDLVMLMDESHRYRAAAGMQAINQLKPVLGLELTATPQIERGSRSEPFKNVIYSYPLAFALRDGFVKEPAVGTRQNFDATTYTEEALEQLKLEDGIRVHAAVKVELETYAIREGKPRVKPFVLVVARDTEHAGELEARIKSDAFFGGVYRDKVITVHSTLNGEEKEENVERLLRVEDPAEPTEIVIHVNMLKEGWDVTNLYTIIPLRAADSRTLVEQSIGRGLRLPYGRRTGVTAVDRLTIIAHDKFQAIIDEANRLGSALRFVPLFIGGDDVPEQGKVAIVTPSPVEQMWTASEALPGVPSAPPPLFSDPEDQRIAQLTVEVIQRQYAHLPSSNAVLSDVEKVKVLADVHRARRESQGELGFKTLEQVEAVATQAMEAFPRLTIDIPRIHVIPTGEMRNGFHHFDLDTTALSYQPVENEILIQHLHDQRRETLAGGSSWKEEKRLEDFVVRALVDRPDVSYDDHAELLYKLAGQVVARLRSYLPNEDAVKNVLQFYERQIGDFVHAQLAQHYWEDPTGYKAWVFQGFEALPKQATTANSDEPVRDFRLTPTPLSQIRSMRFGWMRKSIYRELRFDSDTERKLAVLLDSTDDVEKWFRPFGPPPRIEWKDDALYEPDFVVETGTHRLLIETKAANEVDDADVQAKARAAAEWCRHASDFAATHSAKPWLYVLIPHDQVTAAATLKGLVTRWTWGGNVA